LTFLYSAGVSPEDVYAFSLVATVEVGIVEKELAKGAVVAKMKAVKEAVKNFMIGLDLMEVWEGWAS